MCRLRLAPERGYPSPLYVLIRGVPIWDDPPPSRYTTQHTLSSYIQLHLRIHLISISVRVLRMSIKSTPLVWGGLFILWMEWVYS